MTRWASTAISPSPVCVERALNNWILTPHPIPPRGWRAWAVPVVSLLGMALIATQVRNAALFLTLNGWAAQTPPMLWEWLTALGDTMTALCVVLMLARRRPDIVLAAMIAALVATLATHLVKDVLALPRPLAILGDAVNVIGENLRRGSFPSGHTATAFTLAAVLGVYLRSNLMLAGLVLAAALIGASRIAVGAHWPLDVLGGALMGWCSGLAGVWLSLRLENRERPRTMLAIEVILVLCALDLLTFYDSGYARADILEKSVALIALALYWRSFSRGKANKPTQPGLPPQTANKGSE